MHYASIAMTLSISIPAPTSGSKRERDEKAHYYEQSEGINSRRVPNPRERRVQQDEMPLEAAATIQAIFILESIPAFLVSLLCTSNTILVCGPRVPC